MRVIAEEERREKEDDDVTRLSGNGGFNCRTLLNSLLAHMPVVM